MTEFENQESIDTAETQENLREPLDAELLRLWKRFVPQKAFGALDLNLGCREFRRTFRTSLLDHQIQGVSVDQVIRNLLAAEPTDPYNSIYVALDPTSSSGGDTEQLVYQQFQPEFLDYLEKELQKYETSIEKSQVPELIKKIYRQKVATIRRLINLRLALATPEFTRQQQTSEQWRDLLDLEASAENRQITLPHENLAKRILENNKSAKIYKNVTEALDAIWNLSNREKKEIGYASIAEDTENLTTEQGIVLFRILLRRANLENWTVRQYPGSAIKINSQAKEVLFPESRTLDSDEVAFIPAHEFVHIISGANGSTQPCSAIESGVEGFAETQEGLAAVAEVIVGQPYGHKRQVLFAARYFAVAQALKTKYDEETGQYSALYSMQDIFDQLISYGISTNDASETVWRISRGTSLTRQVVELDVLDVNGEKIKVAETYTKDVVYFSGLMKIYEYLKQLAPLSPEDRNKKRIGEATDFRPTVLAHIGRRVRESMMGSNLELSMDREGYFNLVRLGREKIIELLNGLLIGKLTLEMMTDPDSEWLQFLNQDGLIDYQKIFIPAE